MLPWKESRGVGDRTSLGLNVIRDHYHDACGVFAVGILIGGAWLEQVGVVASKTIYVQISCGKVKMDHAGKKITAKRAIFDIRGDKKFW